MNSRSRINLHIYQSPFKNESRILRITSTLVTNGIFDKVIIVASYEKGLKEIEDLDKFRTVYRIKTVLSPRLNSFSRYFYLIEWAFRIYFKFRNHNVIVVNPHSVPTLPIAVIFKRLLKSKIFYDTHEIETEQYSANSLVKILSKYLERRFIFYADKIFTTSDGYTDWYKFTYKVNNVYTIKNYSTAKDPDAIKFKNLKSTFSLVKNDILFVYQGIIAKGRGVDLLLEVFRKCPDHFHIVFMGYGPETNLVIEETKINPKVHYHPAVQPVEVYQYVQSCDVGLCIIENFHLSYYHTLPNKMLECLNVGVPVIVSNFPDMKRSVEEFDCGWAVEVDEKYLFQLIRNLDISIIQRKRQNAFKWAQINTWESQEKILIRAYSDLK
jgi:glycosyltransferase involved in cell wall biosynthesis